MRSVHAGVVGFLLLLAPAAEAARTVVSITFGGAFKNQLTAMSMLDSYGFKGTFYIATGVLGQSPYLSADDVKRMAADGHEIGGLTIDHVVLTSVSHDEAVHQVCGCRQALSEMGITAVSFDYPNGAADADVKKVVKDCGFTSGRGSWGLACSFSHCAAAEPIPPADPYWIRTPEVVSSNTTLGQIERYVTDAEDSGGGWVPLAFLRVCDGCGDYSIAPQDFESLLGWLSTRAVKGTVVKTVAQVMGGTPVQPPPHPPPEPAVAQALRPYPNPWRADRNAGSGITIDGLPPNAAVRLFSTAGRLIRVLDVPAGGKAIWDLADGGGRAVRSGLYLYLIDAPGSETRRGTLVILR